MGFVNAIRGNLERAESGWAPEHNSCVRESPGVTIGRLRDHLPGPGVNPGRFEIEERWMYGG